MKVIIFNKIIIILFIVVLKDYFNVLEFEDMTTPAPPRLHYNVEVKLVNLGDGFTAPVPGSSDFEVISNTISDSFSPVLEKLPGYYQIRLNELQK